MKILGVSCYYHDSAAALVCDGRIVAAGAEERFSRRKHDSRFPEGAIRFCLEQAGLGAGDLDAVVYYEKPIRKFDRLLQTALGGFPRTGAAFVQAIPKSWRLNLRVENAIRRHFGKGFRGKVLYGEHHRSHAASAFFPSGFESAAVLTVDGVGEWATASVGVGRGNRLELQEEIRFPHSLGLLYSALTAYLGFEVNEGEWKVMGLAPYGKPKYVEQASRLLSLAEDGSFRLDLTYFGHTASNRRAFSPAFEDLFGRPARHPEADLEPFHEDVAASGQKVLEEALLHAARHALRRTGERNLCMAGGVALNGVANWRILRETGCADLFVQPAAGDDGGALGAALDAAASVFDAPRPPRLESVALGPSFSDAACAQALRSLGYEASPEADEALLPRVAALLGEGKVVGWFDGRMEFGPRSLGHRSILADPTNPRMKEIVNARVKFREHFRPFAPSVALEDAHRYFETVAGQETPFMVLVAPVRPGARERLPAITHVDGSARLQTVNPRVEPRYHALLRAFERVRGVPVLMNTSFNVKGEPIVCTPADALRTFEGCGLDALVLGPYLVAGKRDGAAGRGVAAAAPAEGTA